MVPKFILVKSLGLFSFYKNPTAAVGKVAQFLNRSLSDDVIRSIANKCSFNNLKSADEALKTETNVVSSELTEDEIQQRKSPGRLSVFRKGILKCLKSDDGGVQFCIRD